MPQRSSNPLPFETIPAFDLVPAMAVPLAVPAFEKFEYETKNAFHGAQIADARKIWAERKFNPPEPGADGRFGPGIYFWENSRQAAITWVRIYYRTSACGVIQAQLKCNSLLDLLTGEHFHMLEVARNHLAKYLGKPVNQVKHAAVLSFLSAYKAIDGVRGIAGHRGSTINPDSGLAGPFEVILCVFEPMNIIVTGFIDRSDGRSIA